jgi:PIN domain nuclease of toxin-antitoxin system
MRWGSETKSETKLVGIIYQEREDAELQWLNGSQVTGLTYIEGGSQEVKLQSASKLDVNLLSNATVAGVLYQDREVTDVQLLPGSMIVGMVYEATNAPGIMLLRAARPELELISSNNVQGLLYQEQGSTEVKLLSDASNLSLTTAAKLVGALRRERQMDPLYLVSGDDVRGILYQEQGSTEVKLLSDASNLSLINGAKVAAILYWIEASSK